MYKEQKSFLAKRHVVNLATYQRLVLDCIHKKMINQLFNTDGRI